MVYEPPPNPDDWICDALPSRHTSESSDTRLAAPFRQEEPITWAAVMIARRRRGIGPFDDFPARSDAGMAGRWY